MNLFKHVSFLSFEHCCFLFNVLTFNTVIGTILKKPIEKAEKCELNGRLKFAIGFLINPTPK